VGIGQLGLAWGDADFIALNAAVNAFDHAVTACGQAQLRARL
jgi:hypothetical protein